MGLFGFGGQKKKKGGWVYVGESCRKDGSKKIYVGKTSRSPAKRWGEHIDSVRSGKKSSWVSKGTYFKPIGAAWSSNPTQAEKTLKRKTSSAKRSFGRYAARSRRNRSNLF